MIGKSMNCEETAVSTSKTEKKKNIEVAIIVEFLCYYHLSFLIGAIWPSTGHNCLKFAAACRVTSIVFTICSFSIESS
uniref:Uncharacterized protein n=1 Tax=Rhizophora mucronata TaxID=61149 RepID=A0A2P2Q5L9_RHIMU